MTSPCFLYFLKGTACQKKAHSEIGGTRAQRFERFSKHSKTGTDLREHANSYNNMKYLYFLRGWQIRWAGAHDLP